MDEREWLAGRFEQHRPRLQVMAHRMLGSSNEAEDAVQEAWLRLGRSETSGIENLGAWLTTIVARVCLNVLRSRRSRREEPLDTQAPGVERSSASSIDPEAQAQLADSVGVALLVVLETLNPAERVAFVLHDLFDVPFDEIASVLGRSPAAARQVASRARRRIRGAPAARRADPDRRREVVAAFLAASREGDFDALLGVLDPDVELRADVAAVQMGSAGVVRGAPAVAETFRGRARAARPVLVDGVPGAVFAPGGRPRVVFRFTITRGRITGIDLIADPDHLSRMDLTGMED